MFQWPNMVIPIFLRRHLYQKIFIIYFSGVQCTIAYMHIDVTECWNNDNNNDEDKFNKLMHGDCKPRFLPLIALATF